MSNEKFETYSHVVGGPHYSATVSIQSEIAKLGTKLLVAQ